ncbi:MAG: DNA-binding domain-containing protein [Kofleriaceae bacterium]
MADLATLQRRFYELVTSGAAVVEPDLFTGPPRLGVYADMYLARLHDTLADDYPKLRTALGDEVFHDLVVDYVAVHPPRSFTLRDAGTSLAAYLTTRSDLPPWAADLAALERARIEVFDGHDAVALGRNDVARVAPEAFPDLRLAWVPASVLVTLAWTVDELWDELETDAPVTAPRAAARLVLVWRRDQRIFHRTLDDDEADLAALVTARATFAELSARLVERDATAPEERAVELLVRWLDAEALAARATSQSCG